MALSERCWWKGWVPSPGNYLRLVSACPVRARRRHNKRRPACPVSPGNLSDGGLHLVPKKALPVTRAGVGEFHVLVN